MIRVNETNSGLKVIPPTTSVKMTSFIGQKLDVTCDDVIRSRLNSWKKYVMVVIYLHAKFIFSTTSVFEIDLHRLSKNTPL